MEKKVYQSPRTTVVVLVEENSILAGSPTISVGDDTIKDGFIDAKNNTKVSDLWADDEEEDE